MEDSKMIEKEDDENNTGSALEFSPKFKRELLQTIRRPTTGSRRLCMIRYERITTVYPNPTPEQLENCTKTTKKKKKKSFSEEARDLTNCFLALAEEHEKLNETLEKQGVTDPIEENPTFIDLEKRALPLMKRHLALENRFKKEQKKAKVLW